MIILGIQYATKISFIRAYQHTLLFLSGDFKKEDLAKSWLLTHLSEVAMTTVQAASQHNIKHVFVAGSLAKREFVRKHMTREITRVDQSLSMWGQKVKLSLY